MSVGREESAGQLRSGRPAAGAGDHPSPGRLHGRNERDDRSLPSSLATRLARSFGQPLDGVTVHAGLPPGVGDALAAARGDDIYLAPDAPRPGSLPGDLLLAHETAHVLQQRGSVGSGTGSSRHEREASRAAVSAVVPTSPRRFGVPGGRGLALQRCSRTEAPDNLGALTTQEQGSLVERALSEDNVDRDAVVYRVFEAARDSGGFVALTDRLDMPRVLRSVGPWTAVRIGSLGPITSGADLLNGHRRDLIWEAVEQYGLDRAQIFVLWIVDSTQDDQIIEVLRLLAADRRLSRTVGAMPAVRERLVSRGIDLGAIPDRRFEAGDLLRGAWGAVDDILSSSPAVREGRGSAYYFRQLDLPEPYQQALGEMDQRTFEQTMNPSAGALVYGGADYLTFGMLSGVHGGVTGIASGIGHLWQGEWEDAVRTLLVPAAMIATLIGLRIRARRSAAAAAAGEATATLTVEQALARLEPESATALRGLMIELGEARIKAVAAMVEASSDAAAFVGRHKQAGVVALADAAGDIAAAEALLVERVQTARLPNGRLVPPSHRGGGYHGTSEIAPADAFRDGLPARGTDVGLENQVVQGANRAFRGTTATPMTPTGEAGAAHWAGEGGWVYQIDGVPTWDVNALLEGQRVTPGGFAGNLMAGELEGAIPARVPASRIQGAYPVVPGRGTGLRLGPFEPNPHYVAPGAAPTAVSAPPAPAVAD